MVKPDPIAKGIGYFLGVSSGLLNVQGVARAINQSSNISLPNNILSPEEALTLWQRYVISDDTFSGLMLRHGYDAQNVDRFKKLGQQLLPLGELVNAARRGVINVNEFVIRAQQIGISETDAKIALAGADYLFPPEVVIDAWRRGFFKEGERNDLFDDLRAQGWTDERIAILKQVTEQFPPAQDLIRFAVREVFSPDIAEKFGLFEDFPPQFLEQAKKAGLSEEVAKWYWASHWDLPSPTQGFDMLQRGIINEDELKLLLRSLDIMPYWRERLVKLSYSPFTRVDVRRMYKLGVLNREEVTKSYMDLGYNRERAEKLTDFTIKEVEAGLDEDMTDDERQKKEFSGLTRSNIISAYQDRIITRDKASEYLDFIGLQQQVIDFYLLLADYEVEQQNNKFKLENIKETYIAGGMSRTEAIEALGKMNIVADYQEKLLGDWDEAISRKNKQPTKDDLESFFKGKIITEDEFRDEMSRLGYSRRYIEWYVKGLTKKK